MLEVADILRAAGAAYRQALAVPLLNHQLKALRDLTACRTAALGGHLRRCDRCGRQQYSYHSCRNRHCPKCQQDRAQAWLATQRSRLLPCAYYLLTFTLPAELRGLARSHPKIVYGMLMRTAAAALIKLTADPTYLGACPGLLGVLHTWTQALLYHPHAHFLVTAGGLDHHQRWIEPRNPAFLVPCRPLSIIFRAKLKAALRKAGWLTQVAPQACNKNWVVHAQHAGSGDKVLDYLGRYIYRVAISNSRLETFHDGQVCFRYRDRKSATLKRCTLSAAEFIRRFLDHILPPSFAKVRYYGLFSAAHRQQLDQARILLAAPRAAEPSLPGHDHFTASAAQLPTADRCPFCHTGHMRVIEVLTPMPRAP